MNSLNKGEGVPLLNFVGDPGVPLLNFEGGSGIPFLNFREVPGPTFKLRGGSQVSSPTVSWSWVLGSQSHFYTMLRYDMFSSLSNQRSDQKRWVTYIKEKCVWQWNMEYHWQSTIQKTWGVLHQNVGNGHEYIMETKTDKPTTLLTLPTVSLKLSIEEWTSQGIASNIQKRLHQNSGSGNLQSGEKV